MARPKKADTPPSEPVNELTEEERKKAIEALDK